MHKILLQFITVVFYLLWSLKYSELIFFSSRLNYFVFHLSYSQQNQNKKNEIPYFKFYMRHFDF